MSEGGAAHESRVVLVTGASSGIGRATAAAFASAGARSYGSVRDDAGEAALRDAEPGVVPVRFDVTDQATVDAAVGRIVDVEGRIDVLVNNAGVSHIGAVETTPDSVWRDLFEVNVLGGVRLLRAVLPVMRAAGSGVVVNVTSMNGRVPPAFGAPYAASKFAMEAISESLLFEVEPFGIRVVVPRRSVDRPAPTPSGSWRRGRPPPPTRSGSRPCAASWPPRPEARFLPFCARRGPLTRSPGMSVFKRLLLALALLVPGTMLAASPSVSAAPVWAPAATATIHPGVQVFTNGAQCTANFVYLDGTGAVFLGQAAHCSSTGTNTDTDGCATGSAPLGTPVEITGASRPGRLAYNSWLTMQALGESDPDVCAYNDLALIQIDPADVAKVNPSVPHWGGPVGLNTTGLTALDSVYSYGNSSLRLGVTQLSPKTGVSNGDTGGGWSHGSTMVTPGVPGDSGSALLDASGRAAGVLSTLGISLPDGSTNNWGDLSRELQYANSHAGLGVSLVPGTVAFNSGQLPLGVSL